MCMSRQASTGAAALLERLACALVSVENHGLQQQAGCSLLLKLLTFFQSGALNTDLLGHLDFLLDRPPSEATEKTST